MDKSPSTITFKLPYSSGELVLKFKNVSIVAEPLRLNGKHMFVEQCDHNFSVTPEQALPALLARSDFEPNITTYVLNVQLEMPSVSLQLGDWSLDEQAKRIAAYAVELDSQRTFDADTFVRHLISRTQHSLEKLVLNIGPGIAVRPIKCSIRGLARLRHVELSTILFVASQLQLPRLYPVTGRSDSSTVHDMDNDIIMMDVEMANSFRHDESDANATRVCCLADLLPARVETLRINMPNEATHVVSLQDMFVGFEAQWATRFPRLTRIDVHVTVYVNCQHRPSPIQDKEVEQCWNEFFDKNRFIQLHVRREKCHCC